MNILAVFSHSIHGRVHFKHIYLLAESMGGVVRNPGMGCQLLTLKFLLIFASNPDLAPSPWAEHVLSVLQ